MNINVTKMQALFLLNLMTQDIEKNAIKDTAGNVMLPPWMSEVLVNLTNIAKVKDLGYDKIDDNEPPAKSPIILLN